MESSQQHGGLSKRFSKRFPLLYRTIENLHEVPIIVKTRKKRILVGRYILMESSQQNGT